MVYSSSSDKCKRSIQYSKYERNSSEIQSWWFQLFHLLESDAEIPAHKRIDSLRKVFTEHECRKLIALLGSENPKFPAFNRKYASQYRQPEVEKEESIRPKTGSSVKTEYEFIEKSEDVYKKVLKDIFDEDTLTAKKKISSGKQHDAAAFINFFKRGDDAAIIWKSKPRLPLNRMNLNQKKDSIVEKIATEFIDWYNTLMNEGEGATIDVNSIIKIFEVGLESHAATSLRVRMKQVTSLPRSVCDARNMAEQSKRSNLYREIKKDIAALQHKQLHIAFGRRIPMTTFTSKVDIAQTWLQCKNVPEKLETMAAVWQGITNLRATQSFCEYLLEHPEIPRPAILLQSGLLDPKQMKHSLIPEEKDEECIPCTPVFHRIEN